MPGVPMAIVNSLNRNSLGVFGYALGRAGDQTCLYGWQSVSGSGDTGVTTPLLSGPRGSLSLRLRLCRAKTSPAALVAVMQGLGRSMAARCPPKAASARMHWRPPAVSTCPVPAPWASPCRASPCRAPVMARRRNSMAGTDLLPGDARAVPARTSRRPPPALAQDAVPMTAPMPAAVATPYPGAILPATAPTMPLVTVPMPSAPTTAPAFAPPTSAAAPAYRATDAGARAGLRAAPALCSGHRRAGRLRPAPGGSGPHHRARPRHAAGSAAAVTRRRPAPAWQRGGGVTQRAGPGHRVRP